jgi:hypothetical protein
MLFMPTSNYSAPPFTSDRLVKGQLYNLDLDRMLGFQFNPENLEYGWSINWATLTSNRDDTGGDLYYLNSTAEEFEIPLLFAADPGAPDLRYRTNRSLSTSDLKMDFHAIVDEIREWCAPIRELGRPSRVRVIFGKTYFDAVILSVNVKQSEHFPDLAVWEGMIGVRFRKWQMRRAS